MTRILFIIIAISMTILSCDGPQKKNGEVQSKANVPQKNIKVNKEYDANGNLIKYDSTYSSYYSNFKGETTLRDSIFNNFRSQFNQKYFFSDHPFFKNFFFKDSLLKYDFYKKDFFLNRFKKNMALMDSLFMEMDKTKNDFFNNQLKPHAKL